jgi:hypothetical protein
MKSPRVFISYSHDSSAHQNRVLELANRMRVEGIDAIIDQYIATPPQGWAAWLEDEVSKADFVLMVWSQAYLRQLDGKPTERRGSALHGKVSSSGGTSRTRARLANSCGCYLVTAQSMTSPCPPRISTWPTRRRVTRPFIA